MTGQTLYHLVAADLWNAAKAQQKPYYPPTYETDGFIHLTSEPSFLLKVANHFYRDSPHKDWLLLILDPAKLSSKVVFEPAAPVGSKATFSQDSSAEAGAATEAKDEGPLFPHLYGTIDYAAVIQEVRVERDAATGEFLGIPGIATAASSS